MTKTYTNPHDFRMECRLGEHKTHTSNVCPGYVQANLLVIHQEYAEDFKNLCSRNPVPCPLIGYTVAGDPTKMIENEVLTDKDINIALDFPKYNIYI